jgi:hypothetical protein
MYVHGSSLARLAVCNVCAFVNAWRDASPDNVLLDQTGIASVGGVRSMSLSPGRLFDRSGMILTV